MLKSLIRGPMRFYQYLGAVLMLWLCAFSASYADDTNIDQLATNVEDVSNDTLNMVTWGLIVVGLILIAIGLHHIRISTNPQMGQNRLSSGLIYITMGACCIGIHYIMPMMVDSFFNGMTADYTTVDGTT